MKYSVIVPFWNSAEWLGRCLDSLKKQPGDFEFILVDDHSTDNGKYIAGEYCIADARINLYTNEHQKGVSGARNTGIDHATGDWVTFLDADDELCNKVWHMYERMTFQTEYNIIQSNHLRRYANRTAKKFYEIEGSFDLEHLPQCWCVVWNKLIKREFLSDLRFVEGLQYGEDEVFVLDCLSKDNRLWHCEDITIIRHFDNLDSLSRSKGKEQLIAQCQALEGFLMRSDNPTARVTACKVLAEHWGSARYHKAFGK